MPHETEHADEDQRAQTAWMAPDVIPALRYDDAAAAIDWLERAFGFERVAVHEGEGGRIDHAELRAGSGMVMLGSARESPEWPSGTPRELGGVTGGVYVVVDDPDAHFERATAAGAEIIDGVVDTDYGSRGYAARDPEGYLWSFGTYRPTTG
jgi:uncharacterized glyoxalase superfamily protein PhnB